MTTDNLFTSYYRQRKTQVTDKEAMKIILRYANLHDLSRAQTARLIAKWRNNRRRVINQGESLDENQTS